MDYGKVIVSYPNHIYINNTLYIGTQFTKKVVKPDSDGYYKIRYKREDHYHTLEELLSGKIAPRMEKPKIKPKPIEKPKKEPIEKPKKKSKGVFSLGELSDLCEELGVNSSGYKNYLYRQKISYTQITEQGHRIKIEEFKNYLAGNRESSVQKLCREYDVHYYTYRQYMYSRGFKLSDISDHRKSIIEYRNYLFKEGKLGV